MSEATEEFLQIYLHGQAVQPREASADFVLPEETWQGLNVAFTFVGADLTLFLTGQEGRVAADEDFAFYNQPSASGSTARLLGKTPEGSHHVERAVLHLAALPKRVRHVAVAINIGVDTGLDCGSLTHAAPRMDSATSAAWVSQPPADPNIRAMAIAELYRRTVESWQVWKLRAIGQGWSDDLNDLARAYGVDVE